MTTFKEGSNTTDTVSFTGCTDTTLTFDLTNSGSSYTISDGNGLDLELKHTESTLTLKFQYDSGQWPTGSTVSVALGSGSYQSLPYTFSNTPTSSIFAIQVSTPSGQIVWDPKIKVIPPVRGV
jgi:hypothetical protein